MFMICNYIYFSTVLLPGPTIIFQVWKHFKSCLLTNCVMFVKRQLQNELTSCCNFNGAFSVYFLLFSAVDNLILCIHLMSDDVFVSI